MKLKTFTLRTNLLSKLLLSLALLLIGGGNISAERHITISGQKNNTSGYHPFYGFRADYQTCSQYIIHRDSLTAVQGEAISKIKLYFTASNRSWGAATFRVYLKEVDATTFSSDFISWESLTQVYSGSLSIDSSKEMTVTFDTPFNYTSNHLLIGFKLETAGTGNSAYCVGNNGKGNVSRYTYYSTSTTSSSTSNSTFLPKTTIFFTGTAEPTLLTASEIAYNSATLSWTAGDSETQWQVYYSTSEGAPDEGDVPDPISSNSKTLTGLLPETLYYCYVRAYVDADTHSEWVSTSFSTYEQYPIPTNFSLSDYTATSASFSWTNGLGTTPTSLQLRYSTDSGFNPANDEGVLVDNISTSTNPYTLTGLTEDITYYASIRAFYGGENYSGWTEKVEFTPSDIKSLLLNDDTKTSSNFPIDNHTNSGEVMSQMIFVSSDLLPLQNRQITEITFYATSSTINWSTPFDVYLRETATSEFAYGATFESWGTNVYSGTLSVKGGEMTITLTTPFNYTTGNLMVGIKQRTGTTTTTSVSSTWYGTNITNRDLYYYSGISNDKVVRGSVTPKIKITSQSVTTAPVQIDANGYTTFASPWPLNLSAASQSSLGFTAYKATVDAGNSRVLFTSGIDQDVSANTGLLLSGTPNETYLIPVAESGTALADNALLVNDGTLVAESGYTYYALKKNSDPLVFGTFDPSTVAIPSNKAYLKVENEYAVKGLSFEFDNPTAVQNIKEAQPAVKGAIYDLSGRRVAQPKKGLYIIDGKKVVIK